VQYRQLGRTGLQVSAMGLGTWQLGGEWGKRFSQAEVDQLLGRAGELGINLIDTAECYGDHVAESLVGSAIHRHRADWIVATKFGHQFHPERMTGAGWTLGSVRSEHWPAAQVSGQLDRSLSALRTDYVDLYLFHSGSDEVFDQDELWARLTEQVGRGKIRYLGVALGASDNLHQTERATQAGASVIELTYNRLNRAAEHAVFPACHQQDLGVLAREPLANGYLTGRYTPSSGITSTDDWRAGLPAHEVQDRLETVERIRATEVPPGTPMAAWALAWCLRQPAVDAVITGVRSVDQLHSSAAAIDLAVR
jgi:aryl-alcohol dehydrogenase-like predicted oxidoreductase